MKLYIFGVNYRTATLMLRELLAFSPEHWQNVLPRLIQLPGIDEALVLTTCNRTEFYLSCAADQPRAMHHFLDWLCDHTKLALAQLLSESYQYEDDEALRHLMRVASGLDSMLLGEPQIFGQLKKAYQAARQVQSVHHFLDQVLQFTFASVKKIRDQTAIGDQTISLAFAAIKLASQHFKRFDNIRALLIGAGETIALVARYLHQAGIQGLIIANRTLTHAQHLAQSFNAVSIALDNIPQALLCADLVISATASETPILRTEEIARILPRRHHRRLLLLDLAIPRDIDSAVGKLENVLLYTLADFEKLLAEHQQQRQQAVYQAEILINQQIDQWRQQQLARNATELIVRYRQQNEQIGQQALKQALQQLAQGSPVQHVLERLANQLTNKLMHYPTIQLRLAAIEQQESVLQAAEQLLLNPTILLSNFQPSKTMMTKKPFNFSPLDVGKQVQSG